MRHALRYALITPARNEAANLRRLAGSVAAQTVGPEAWMIVDDGSTDDTREVAASLERRFAWVRVVDSPQRASRPGALSHGRSSGRDVLAFNAGVATLGFPVDVVVKLDGDVSFAPDFFERLMEAFHADPLLGIASGTCYELEAGRWIARHVAGGHVRGATRAWRWACLATVSPLEERLGWDIVDELKANTRGWRTSSLPIPFFHHRPVGQRDGRLRSWRDQGETAYYVGYRFPYLLAKAAFQMRNEPAALALVWGYVAALLTGREHHSDAAVRECLRDKQRLRDLPLRVREATGRSA